MATNVKQNEELQIELTISGFNDFNEIQNSLPGLKPSTVTRVGEPKALGPNKVSESLRYKRNTWAIVCSLSQAVPVETRLERFLEDLEPFQKALKELSDKYDVLISIHGYVYVSLLGFQFSKEAISRLAKLGAILDIDVYSLPEPD